MKLQIILILVIFASSVLSISELMIAKESIKMLRSVASSELGKEWNQKLGEKFKSIAKITTRFAKYVGPAGDLLEFTLAIVGGQQDLTEKYLKDISNKLDKVDQKLTAISQQIYESTVFLDDKITHSTTKIITEVKYQTYAKHSEDLSVIKLDYESIISSYYEGSTSLIEQLDRFINQYKSDASDAKLVNAIGSGSEFSNSLVSDIIKLSKSYQKRQSGTLKSSTMKIVYDFYLTTIMKIIKANAILECAINLKSAITGEHHEADRRYFHHKNNQIFKQLFESFENVFSKLDENDMEGFVDFDSNGNSNKIRFINVIQTLFVKEDALNSQNDCSGVCEDFKNHSYTGDGCHGSVRNCQFGTSIRSSLGQYILSPYNDRIYERYRYDIEDWHGRHNPGTFKTMRSMLSKKNYFICHVCKCICDQHSHPNTIRKIYTGKISAPDGWVITGIRFIQSHMSIYPQIEIGKLLEMGTIDQKNVRWLEVPQDNNYVNFDLDMNRLMFEDLNTMSFANGVVTGVQFKDILSGVAWTIYGRKLSDFNKGILGAEMSIRTIPYAAEKLDATELIPELSSNGLTYTIKNSLDLTFGISNDGADAGQSYVPYFDGNEIMFHIRAPLSGISLIHYTNDYNYAGYIRPVIRSLNYRNLFKPSFQSEEFISVNLQN